MVAFWLQGCTWSEVCKWIRNTNLDTQWAGVEGGARKHETNDYDYFVALRVWCESTQYYELDYPVPNLYDIPNKNLVVKIDDGNDKNK